MMASTGLVLVIVTFTIAGLILTKLNNPQAYICIKISWILTIPYAIWAILSLMWALYSVVQG